ncbi:MAG TPA: hypothetical protein VLE50_04970, partial [Cellvibrio sp.]|nr:hypothetical protein [Cellvibrio sp.]
SPTHHDLALTHRDLVLAHRDLVLARHYLDLTHHYLTLTAWSYCLPSRNNNVTDTLLLEATRNSHATNAHPGYVK